MRRWVVTVLVVMMCASCGSSSKPTATGVTIPTETVRLVHSGGCRNGFFWAANADDTVALTVSVKAPGRYDYVDTFDIAKGSLKLARTPVTASLQYGRALSTALCTDTAHVSPSHKIDKAVPVVAGTGGFFLDGRTCPREGNMDLTGLKAKDGTRIVVRRIETHRVGCATG